ncbi:MAG: bifunctional phosphoribosyl-AMP cyclohydrolase/phosphoribosyl-ATP diphosphatase HisIE [Dehalococcoidia bacterium]|nr:bifunctional phosphoribosyl-AMP cyclohydrolase/phosphoribosyl-ATP diphosphatase HisIE [Dehalococcoidia bacterium]
MPTQLIINEKALIPAIAQDAVTGAVLMVAYMNHQSLTRTIESGQAWFYSRSRQELWHKGATSGHFLNVVEIRADCDGDVILLKVNAEGPACHTGNESCFYEEFDTSDWQMEPAAQDQLGATLTELAMTVAQRRKDMPEGSYTASLFERGTERIAQKVIEEGGETALAAMAKAPDRVRAEAADLLYHLTILLEDAGVSLSDVATELADRRR